MGAHLSDKTKKKIIADRLDGMSYRRLAEKYKVSRYAIQLAIQGDPDFTQKMTKKKEQNTQDILAYMESQKNLVCQIIGLGLEALAKPDKFADASPSQITTALGTIIDKWAAISGSNGDQFEDDALSKSLKELAEGLESDDR